MNYPFTPNAFQRPYNALTQVSGLEGAKAYQMPPDSAVALFHNAEDVFYVKTTDGAGFPKIRAFRFEEMPLEPVPGNEMRAELNAIKKELEDVKQLVRKDAAIVDQPVCAGGEGQPEGDVRQPDAV